MNLKVLPNIFNPVAMEKQGSFFYNWFPFTDLSCSRLKVIKNIPNTTTNLPLNMKLSFNAFHFEDFVHPFQCH